MLSTNLLNDRHTHVLEVYVTYAVSKLLQHLNRVLASEGEVAGVEAQEYVLGIGVLHQVGGLLNGLYHGAHVMMEAGTDAVLLEGQLAQLVQALAQTSPLLIGQDALVLHIQNGNVGLALDGTGLLGDVDCSCANILQVLQLLDELSLNLFVRLVNQEGREPLGRDGHTTYVQHMLEDNLVLGILMTDLGTGETSQCHLRDTLLESVFVAEIPHIIVGPTNRAHTESYFLGI